jgi:hypothetical protein
MDRSACGRRLNRRKEGFTAWISQGTQPAPLEINAGHMFRSYPWAGMATRQT